jgi:6-phosphogluconate dehydrogenase
MMEVREKPRTAWVMLPAGKITEATIEALAKLMEPGDIIIDGGNTFWQGRYPPRQGAGRERGIRYVDVGTSGGVWGIERGYCMMIGGDEGGGRSPRSDLLGAGAGLGDIPRTPGRDGGDPAPSAATFTPARPAPGTSSRWSITASNTA